MPSIPSAGISAAASFELAGLVPPTPPVPILAEAINARSRQVVSLTRGVPVADGIVGYLIGLQRGSGAAVRSFGQSFRELRHVDSETTETLDSMVREALEPATNAGILRVKSIDLSVNAADPTQIDGTIVYRDLLERRTEDDSTFTIKED